MVDRYFSQVHAVSYTSIVCSPASQLSSLLLIRRRILQDLVMCWVRWRVTICNTMNLYAFQRRFQTRVSSAASTWTKRRPTRPLSVSYQRVGITVNFLHRA